MQIKILKYLLIDRLLHSSEGIAVYIYLKNAKKNQYQFIICQNQWLYLPLSFQMWPKMLVGFGMLPIVEFPTVKKYTAVSKMSSGKST